MASEGYIMFFREKGYELLTSDPKSFLLLTLIAIRARRTELELSPRPLKINQAFLGDHDIISLSRQEYRDALIKLEGYGLIEFETTNKGTIATLISTKVYDINTGNNRSTKNKKLTAGQSDTEPSKFSMKTERKEPSDNLQETSQTPSNNQEATTKPPPTHQQISNEEPLTNKPRIQEEEEFKEQNKATTARSSWHVSGLFPCLQGFDGTKGFGLTDDEKLSLMQYPEERVELALEYASHLSTDIKKDLISLLHWHCQEDDPIAPGKKNPRKKWHQRTKNYADDEESRIDVERKNRTRMDGGPKHLESLLQNFQIPSPK